MKQKKEALNWKKNSYQCDDIDIEGLFERIRTDRIEELLQCLNRESLNKAYDDFENVKNMCTVEQKRIIEAFLDEIINYEAHLSEQIYYHGFCDGMKAYIKMCDLKAKLIGNLE